MPNRLADAASPYLRQHADNPIDWYPWGPEALARARAEDRPILLSIGYAACHWCHVMAHESFADPEVAALANAHFVSIKVDREERPDLDALYQTICQLVTRQGGWPLTVFLTPEAKPFYVGTYFPRESRFGRPGFKELLRAIAEAWTSRREAIEQVAEEWAQAVARVAGGQGLQLPEAAEHEVTQGEELVRRHVADLVRSFDRVHGGFGTAPKFPNPPSLALLLTWTAGPVEGEEPWRLACFALEQMARGGIYDQLGGGFHRYSVDEAWRVPHFEKMLYDNALLPPLYLQAYQRTGRSLFAAVARETLDWLLADLRTPEGTFASSLDADSEGEEGRYYLWSAAQVRAALGEEDAELALRYFGLDPADPDTPCVLRVAHTASDLAAETGAPEEEVFHQLERVRAKLRAARTLRVPPARDDKILAGWNGLTLSALCAGAQVLGEARYLAAAEEAAEFLLARLRDERGRLLRRYARGQAAVLGQLEDYAYLCAGLIDLYETTFAPRWVEEAYLLARDMVARFYDAATGAFYLTAPEQDDVLARPRAAHDAGLPAPQSAAVKALLRLGPLTGDERLLEIAGRVLEAHASLLARPGLGLESLVDAYAFSRQVCEVTVVAPDSSAEAKDWIRRLWARFLPYRILAFASAGDLASRTPLPPIFVGRSAQAGRPTAYVCRNFVCSPPLFRWEEIEAALNG